MSAKLEWLGSRIVGPGGLRPANVTGKSLLVICLSIFFVAVGVRLLQWQNNFHTIDKIMSGLTARYKDEALLLTEGGALAFARGSEAGPDTGILMHTPGYPILIALIYKLSGNSDAALRLFQILCDACAAVLVVLITLELLPKAAAAIAGLLVALSPQLTYNSLLLLPDSLSALPILLAVYLIAKPFKRSPFITAAAAGAAIGVSCWLRANALLLAPFLCLLIIVLFGRERRWRYAAAMVSAAFLVMAPITLRNLLVFHSFIPLSLGAGQNLVAGIADYDPQKRFSMEAYDDAASRQEAEMYDRPDYAQDLYRPDGIERERARRSRALSVIRSNKLWFLSIMLRRALFMLEYEEVPIVSVEPSVTNSLQIINETELLWSASPQELFASYPPLSGQIELKVTDDGRALWLAGDDSERGKQFVSKPINIKSRSDYLLRLPVRIERGRMVIRVETIDGRATLASANIPDSIERGAAVKDSMSVIEMPFVSAETEQVRVALLNAQEERGRTIIRFGGMELFRLGPATYLWTRYPRMLVKSFQKFFKTSWMISLALAGVVLLALARRWRVLSVSFAVPVYYLCIHSALHVEHRYALAMHYFFSIPIAVAVYWLVTLLINSADKLRNSVLRITSAS
jgi:hypothetical protein